MDVDLDGLFINNNTYDYMTDYEYKEDVESKSAGAVLIPVLCSVLLLLGLVGNGLLLYALVQKWRSWRESDIFILHLSLADILLLATLPFWAVQAATQSEGCVDGFLCRLCQVIFHINLICGIYLLFLIGLDRYLAIVRSTEMFSKKRPRLAFYLSLSVCILSLILTCPDWGSTASRKGQGLVLPLLLSRVLLHVLGFLLPVGVLLVCCCRILLRLQCSSRGLLENRSLMVFLPLVVLFLLCWTPYNITLIVDTVQNSSQDDALHTARKVTTGLAFSHTFLRPLLTFFLCRNFRRKILGLLQCATVETQSSLWELGLEDEVPLPHDRGQEPDELKQINVEQQVPVQH